MSSGTTDSFVTASNFCTGSQSDYSTCIANNLRFLPYMDDAYEASSYAGLTISNKVLPIINGTTYVDLTPIAIANILTRVKMTNDYGVVSFRCPDVFNRPRLPLPKLQDLGIPAQDIINIIGVDPTEPQDPSSAIEFEGIPLSDDDSELGWLINSINLLIGYTTAVSNTVNKGAEIKGIIANSLDYYQLPGLANQMLDSVDKAIKIWLKYDEYNTKLQGSTDPLVVKVARSTSDFANSSKAYTDTMRTIIIDDIVTPLSVITPDTDFGYFDFTITDGVLNTIVAMEREINPFVLIYGMNAKMLSGAYGNPPKYPIDDGVYTDNLLAMYSGAFRNLVSEALSTISSAYSAVNEVTIATLRGDEGAYSIYKTQEALYYNTLLSLTTDADKLAVINKLKKVVDDFTFVYSNGNIIDKIEALQDDPDSLKIELDLYYSEVGDIAKIELYNLINAQQDLYNSTELDLTEVNIGGNFKDSGNFYYADLAYAVGYTKLTDIHSIQIDDEYYKLKKIEDENGNVISGISESGCTKYTFTRQVLPTYTVEVEMYIYPGTPTQAYCPTVNKYHNFQTSKYYGMFTKLDSDGLMGVYIFKGYRPMAATVEEVIKIGKMDLNSINLNDPSLDKQSYEAMLMTEIKNLTNASSINGTPLTTDDFKYYLSSKIVDENAASIYPGLAIIEFKRFPIGQSLAFPKIKVKVTGEDIVL